MAEPFPGSKNLFVIRVMGHCVEELAANLVNHSTPFLFEPLPEGLWEVVVRPEKKYVIAKEMQLFGSTFRDSNDDNRRKRLIARVVLTDTGAATASFDASVWLRAGATESMILDLARHGFQGCNISKAMFEWTASIDRDQGAAFESLRDRGLNYEVKLDANQAIDWMRSTYGRSARLTRDAERQLQIFYEGNLASPSPPEAPSIAPPLPAPAPPPMVAPNPPL